MSYRWAVNFLFFANGFIYGNWAARIPRIQEVHALSNSQVGFVLLAHSVGAFIAMPITGWLINRYGSHSVSWKAGILLISSLVLIPHVPSYVILLVPFFFVGAFSGTMDVAMNAQAVDVEKHYARPIITSFHALFSIGMFIGGLVSALFIREAPSLWIHLTVVGLTGAILVIAASRHLYVQEKANPADDEVVFAFPRGPILALGIVAFCCMMGEGAIADWSTNYMKKIVGVFDLQTFGLVAFAGMMTVGRLLGDRGRALWGDRWMMVTGALCSLVGILFVLSLWHPWVVIIGFGAVGLGLANIVPIVFSLAGNTHGLGPGVGIAMASTIGYTGFMFGPPIIGFVADASDLRIGLGVLAVLFSVMTLIVLLRKGESKQSFKS